MVNNFCEFFDEIYYVFEVVDEFLEKKKDLSSFSDEKLYGSTIKQIDFLKKQNMPETILKNGYNSLRCVHLYRDVLKSLLGDIESDNAVLAHDAIDTYKHIRFSLDSLIGVEEKNKLISDASYLLNDMYDIVTGKTKQNYFKDFKADLLSMVAQ